MYTQRAPSRTALRCSSCYRLLTPCLVCARLLPSSSSSSSSSWRECPFCKARNPLHHQQRKILGIPPASALPSSMVRRVLIAYVGRPASTRAIVLLHHQIKQVVAEAYSNIPCTKRKHVEQKESIIHDVGHLLNLPFTLCEGVITRMECPLDKNWDPGKEEHHKAIVASKEESGISCSTCGSCDSFFWKESPVDDKDAALRRYEELLVSLHCVEALAGDMDQFAYPVCNAIEYQSFSRIGKRKWSCLGGFSINMLRMVNVLFAADFEIWLSLEGKENFKLEEMLTNVEIFLSRKQELLELKDSALKATTAQKQARTDGKALMLRPPSSVSMLDQIFVDKVQARKENFLSIAKPFSTLLSQINLLLEFIYQRACDATSSVDHCIVDGVKPSSQSLGKQYGLEDAREAAKCLFLLYHEVMHATEAM